MAGSSSPNSSASPGWDAAQAVPFFSIIVPVSRADTYLRECLQGCLAQTYPHYEVLLLPDRALGGLPERVRVLPTQASDPSLKRNRGIAEARGNICAFLDADAYPDSEWLRLAADHFRDPEVAALGGPNLTPPQDSLRQQASGFILSSRAGAGFMSHRYNSSQTSGRDAELQSVNMFVRRSVFEAMRGFSVGKWPGEDAELTLRIQNAVKGKVVFAPEVKVYHHRRPLFGPHLKQIWNYGYTKAPLVKKHLTLGRLMHALPSAFLLGLITGPFLSRLSPFLAAVFFSCLAIYLLLVISAAVNVRNIILGALVFLGIPLTHLTYGAAFIMGMIRCPTRRERAI